jgi:hypothetical protein
MGVPGEDRDFRAPVRSPGQPGGVILNRGLAAVIGAVLIAGAVLVLVLQDTGDNAPVTIAAPPTSTAVGSDSTTTSQATPATGGSDCTVVDVRVTANGPLDGVGVRFNPEFEVTASFLESGGDAIVHVNTGYQDEANDQWVTYTWLEGGNLPTPEEAAIPNGRYDAASGALTGTETLHHLIDFEAVAGSPISAPFNATYQPANLVVTGSVALSDGSHTFTLAAQRFDILEGAGCPDVSDVPAP